MNSPRPKLSYEFALVGVTIIWGINFPIVKSALGLVGPLTFNAFRFSVSAVLLGFLYLRERRATASTPRTSFSWRYVIALGVLGHFVYQMLFILGLDRTTAGNSAFLISSAPLWTAFTARLLGYEGLSALAWVGLSIAFLGSATLVVAQFGVDLGGSKTIGNLLSLGGAVAWGSFTALSRPALRHHSPTELAFWTIATALPLLWLVAYFEPSPDGWMAQPEVWGAIIYSGLLSTGVAYIIWNAGIHYVGASHTAVYANMVPVIAFTIGIIWLAETVTLIEIGGSSLILFGLYVMRKAY